MKIQIYHATECTSDVATIRFLDCVIPQPSILSSDCEWHKEWDVYAEISDDLLKSPAIADVINFGTTEITLRRHHMMPWEYVFEWFLDITLKSLNVPPRTIFIDESPPHHLQHNWDEALLYV